MQQPLPEPHHGNQGRLHRRCLQLRDACVRPLRFTVAWRCFADQREMEATLSESRAGRPRALATGTPWTAFLPVCRNTLAAFPSSLPMDVPPPPPPWCRSCWTEMDAAARSPLSRRCVGQTRTADRPERDASMTARGVTAVAPERAEHARVRLSSRLVIRCESLPGFT